MAKTLRRITPFLWFNDNAEEAVNAYVSIFKNSRIGSVTRSPSKRIASPVEMKGLKLLMAAATGAPTFSIAATLKSRPAAVPTTPEKMK